MLADCMYIVPALGNLTFEEMSIVKVDLDLNVYEFRLLIRYNTQ